ncbi:uncharacterized protein BDV14DRAFT_197102 [Aspergillus stella-maris]|uniref:uncharacterized protein n=1 Tax=Aspergillus stella-maris TaxID=1810926 RepID=UPI003CCD37A9
MRESWCKGPIKEWFIESEAHGMFSDRDLNERKFFFESLEQFVDQIDIDGIPIKLEQFLCGDEPSVCGRYAQNALSPAAAVALASGLSGRFGDFKTCSEGSNTPNSHRDRHHQIPDFVATRSKSNEKLHLRSDTKPKMLLAGEAKTWWVHDLLLWFKRWKKSLQDLDANKARFLRRALGQIAQYMHTYQVKYGFLTTYEYTIFIRQDNYQDAEGMWRACLSISRPIHRSETPFGSSEGSPRLSIRQCIYYLLWLTREGAEYKYANPHPLEKWVAFTNTTTDQANAPYTPTRDTLDTPQKFISAISPDIVPETNPSSPIKLYRSTDGTFTTILSFAPDQIDGGRVIVNGQSIRVNIEANPNDSESVHGLTSNMQQLDLDRPTPTQVPTQAPGPRSMFNMPARQGGVRDGFQRKGYLPASRLSTSTLSDEDSFQSLDPQTPTPPARPGLGPMQTHGLVSHLASSPPQQGKAGFGRGQGQQTEQGPSSEPAARSQPPAAAARGKARQKYGSARREQEGMSPSEWDDYQNSTPEPDGKK